MLSGGEEIWTVNTGILPHTVLGKNTVAPAQKCFSARLAFAAQFLPPSMYMRLRIRRSHVRIVYGAPVKSGTYGFLAVGAFCFHDFAPILPQIVDFISYWKGFYSSLPLNADTVKCTVIFQFL